MLRTRTTRWTVGTAALCLLLLAASWFLLVGPRMSDAADLGDRKQTVEDQNQQLQIRIDELKAQATQLTTYRTQLASVLRQLPPDAGMPQLVRDLNALSTAAGVSLDTLTPGSGTVLPASAVAASSGAGGTKVTGVVQIPVTLVVHGDYYQAVAFLQKLQTQLPRAFLVNGVQVAQSSSGGSGAVQVNISGSVFVWPAAAQVTPTPTTGAATTAGTTTAATPSATTGTAAPTTSVSATTGGTP
jgi:Tfp pilus assembly protein PilO